MTSASPTITTTAASRTRNGFAAATATFVTIFAAGGSAIPLYPTYRAVDGVTDQQFALVAVAYMVCAIVALLVLGRLSNHHGRRAVTLLAISLAVVGCIVLLVDRGFWGLLSGRALQGIAAGLASTAVAAYVVDSAPRRPTWLVGVVTGSANVVGLAIGVFVTGALVQFAPWPRELAFIVFIALLAVCGVWIATRAETVQRAAGAWRSLVPRLVVPESARPLMVPAASIFLATWSLGGYFQAFGPSVATEYLGSSAPLIAAAVFASYNGPGVFGGPIAALLKSSTGQRLSISIVVVAALGLVGAAWAGNAALFIASGVVGGVGMGIGMTASLNSLLPEARPEQRAGLLAVVYTLSYAGAAIPGLIAGQLTQVVDLLTITEGYAGLTAIALVVVLVSTRRRATG
jgi:MFS family permease